MPIVSRFMQSEPSKNFLVCVRGSLGMKIVSELLGSTSETKRCVTDKEHSRRLKLGLVSGHVDDWVIGSRVRETQSKPFFLCKLGQNRMERREMIMITAV